MSKVIPGSGPVRKALVPGPRLKIVFDWDRSFVGPDRDGGETKTFVSRTATTLFLLELIIFTVV
jgi:hypothetical protein